MPANDKMDGIRKLLEANPELREFFKVLLRRQRNQRETSVDALVKDSSENMGPEYERRRLVREFFRELENLGIGTLRIGRRGRPTRFIWNAGMWEMMRQFGEGNEEEESRNIGVSHPDGESKTRILPHRYILRENYVVDINLPVNLTETEAERLSAFIKSLPLKEQSKGET